jgi:hypothetical protein
VVIVAPTHTAAINVGGRTLASLMDGVCSSSTITESQFLAEIACIDLLQWYDAEGAFDVIVVEEFSMISTEDFYRLVHLMLRLTSLLRDESNSTAASGARRATHGRSEAALSRPARATALGRFPFLITGDVMQIPPVQQPFYRKRGTYIMPFHRLSVMCDPDCLRFADVGAEVDDAVQMGSSRTIPEDKSLRYSFLSQMFRDGDFRIVVPKHNHRMQSDMVYTDLCNRCRVGELTDDDVQLLIERVSDPFEAKCAVLVATNATRRLFEDIAKDAAKHKESHSFVPEIGTTLVSRSVRVDNSGYISQVTDRQVGTATEVQSFLATVSEAAVRKKYHVSKEALSNYADDFCEPGKNGAPAPCEPRNLHEGEAIVMTDNIFVVVDIRDGSNKVVGERKVFLNNGKLGTVVGFTAPPSIEAPPASPSKTQPPPRNVYTHSALESVSSSEEEDEATPNDGSNSPNQSGTGNKKRRKVALVDDPDDSDAVNVKSTTTVKMHSANFELLPIVDFGIEPMTGLPLVATIPFAYVLDRSSKPKADATLTKRIMPIESQAGLTIHKAQGKTFGRVGVHLDKLEPGQGFGWMEDGSAYVALSRCVGLSGLSIYGLPQLHDAPRGSEMFDEIKRGLNAMANSDAKAWTLWAERGGPDPLNQNMSVDDTGNVVVNESNDQQVDQITLLE